MNFKYGDECVICLRKIGFWDKWQKCETGHVIHDKCATRWAKSLPRIKAVKTTGDFGTRWTRTVPCPTCKQAFPVITKTRSLPETKAYEKKREHERLKRLYIKKYGPRTDFTSPGWLEKLQAKDKWKRDAHKKWKEHTYSNRIFPYRKKKWQPFSPTFNLPSFGPTQRTGYEGPGASAGAGAGAGAAANAGYSTPMRAGTRRLASEVFGTGNPEDLHIPGTGKHDGTDEDFYDV